MKRFFLCAVAVIVLTTSTLVARSAESNPSANLTATSPTPTIAAQRRYRRRYRRYYRRRYRRYYRAGYRRRYRVRYRRRYRRSYRRYYYRRRYRR